MPTKKLACCGFVMSLALALPGCGLPPAPLNSFAAHPGQKDVAAPAPFQDAFNALAEHPDQVCRQTFPDKAKTEDFFSKIFGKDSWVKVEIDISRSNSKPYGIIFCPSVVTLSDKKTVYGEFQMNYNFLSGAPPNINWVPDEADKVPDEADNETSKLIQLEDKRHSIEKQFLQEVNSCNSTLSVQKYTQNATLEWNACLTETSLSRANALKAIGVNP